MSAEPAELKPPHAEAIKAALDLAINWPRWTVPDTARRIDEAINAALEAMKKNLSVAAGHRVTMSGSPSVEPPVATSQNLGNEAPPAQEQPNAETGDPLEFEGWPKFFLRTRERFGLTQDQMAAKLGCGEKSYTRWENGARPTVAVIRSLIRLVALNQILTESYHGHNSGCLNCAAVNEIADHALSDSLISSGESKPVVSRENKESPSSQSPAATSRKQESVLEAQKEKEQ